MVNYLLYPLIVVTVLWIAAFVYFFFSQQKEKEAAQSKNLLVIATVIFLITIAVCVPLHLRNESLTGDFLIQPTYFYTILGSVILLVLGIAFYTYAKLNRKYTHLAKWVLFGTIVAALVATFVSLIVYYNCEIAPYEDYASVNSVWLYVGAALICIILAVICVFFGKKANPKTETRSVTFGAVCVALAFALSYIRLFRLPQGGSITLVSVLPLMLYSQMFGVRKGVIVGVIFGLLSSIQDPWILHPAQFLLDYPIAYACIGLSALFTQGGIKGKRGIALFAAGAVFAVTLRYFSHVISGIFAFSMYAKAGYSAVAWGFLYNTFAFADMAIALGIGVLMLLNSSFLLIVNRVTNAGVITITVTENKETSSDDDTISADIPSEIKDPSSEEEENISDSETDK